MKAIAINGSPRKDGNTRLLLETALEPLAQAGWDTEIVQLGGRPVQGCRACFKCWEKQDKRCVFGDKDVFNEVFAKALEADALLLGSPTYFADVSGDMKSFIERAGFVAMANGCLLAGKIGAAVVAVRRGGAVHVFDSINHLFFISQMVVPGSTYWNLAHGLEPGQAAKDDEGLRNMRHLGQAIAWLGAAMKNSAAPYPVLRHGESA
jgi:multimeric flavodoxin WrbA